jgi:YHS domain-containing protein/thiol-disulfide isomerase/thioredoxin
MKLIFRIGLCGLLLLAHAAAHADELIPWGDDFRTACGMAAEQRRLVLIHFYSDNCGPCVRLEQNVFNKPAVAEAIGQNFIPVKIHAGKNPTLAARFKVYQWPTDLFVTPSGTEVFRTISPREPADYIAMLGQVAQQQGIGVAKRWTPAAMQALTVPGQGTGDRSQELGAGGQESAVGAPPADAGQQQWRAVAQQSLPPQAMPSPVEQVRQERRTWSGVTTAEVPSQSPIDQVRQERKDWVPPGDAWRNYDRSAYMQAEQSPAKGLGGPASPAPAPPQAAGFQSPSVPPPQQSLPASQPPAPVISSRPPIPTDNPWVANRQPQVPGGWASPTAPLSAQAQQPLVPASQAPPVALDGFCPVTLLETVARDPNDRSAWRKGDRNFGAIHRGRTYLFTSAEQQRKFLSNPDAYAPLLAGNDPVVFAERGQFVEGKRAYGIVTPDKRIVLFADETSRNRFEQSPAAYSNAVQQAMLRSEAGNVYR